MLNDFLTRVTKQLFSLYANKSAEQQRLELRVTATLLLFAVPAVGAIIWLILVSGRAALTLNWQPLLIMFVIHYLFSWLDLSKMLNARAAFVRGAHGRFVTWSAVLVWGPVALWFDLLTVLINFAVHRWRHAQSDTPLRLFLPQFVQRLAVTLTRDTLIGLIAYTLYREWGGQLPVRADDLLLLLPAVYSLLVQIGLLLVVMVVVYGVYQYGRSDSILDRGQRLIKFWAAVGLFYILPLPVGILIAGFYSQIGFWGLIVIWSLIYFFSLFAHLVHQTAVRSNKHAHQLHHLEQLARDILHQPVENSELPSLLAKYAPSIFENGWIEIRLLPNHILFAQGEGWIPVPENMWERLVQIRGDYQIIRGIPEATACGYGSEAMFIPVTTKEDSCVGGIFLMRQAGKDMRDWEFAGLALAAQLAADLNRVEQYQGALASQAEAYEKEVYEQAYQAEVYAQALAYEKIAKELAVAGQIQETFLPQGLPDLNGWQIAVTLEPARETSGDFYDFISLPNGRLGLVVADVADKGMGAALYMALSRTLIRIFAADYESSPELALAEANRRILADTSSDLFVTVFYAILEPESGLLTYCNAGHNPPFIQSVNGAPLQRLTRTALPVGLFDDMPWEQAQVQVEPGDVLVIYSDGLTEAEDEAEAYFGEERLIAVTKANMGRSAEVIESKVVTAVIDFVGDAPQMDDITLMILTRNRVN